MENVVIIEKQFWVRELLCSVRQALLRHYFGDQSSVQFSVTTTGLILILEVPIFILVF